MANLGTKFLDDLEALDPGEAPDADLRKRTTAVIRVLVDDGYESHLRAVIAERNAAQHPIVRPSMWTQPGWFGVRYDALPQPSELVAAGVTWVTAVLSHGADRNGQHSLDTDDRENQAWLAAGNAQRYRAAGVKVGGWGWHQGFHAALEAEYAATYITAWGLDHWAANGEEAWKGNEQPEIFAAALDTKVPAAFPVAWSVLGAASGLNVFPFAYSAFTNRGWHILAQAYPQDSPDYALHLCLDHAERAGIPKGMFHVTISNDQPKAGVTGARKPSIAEWGAELGRMRDRGYQGVSYWHHHFTVGDVATLNKAAS